MKRIICLFVILFCSIGFAFAQAGKGRMNTKKPYVRKINTQITKAEKAWIPFWEKFLLIVKNKDRKGLFETMPQNFYFACAYNGGFGFQDNGNRDFEIKKFDGITKDGFDCEGWKTLKKITAKGVTKALKLDKEVKLLNNEIKYVKTVSKYAPMCWHKSACNGKCDDGFALFEFHGDHWFFVELVGFCETE